MRSAPVNKSSPRDVALANQRLSIWREAGASAFYHYLRLIIYHYLINDVNSVLLDKYFISVSVIEN